jgi:dolichyl-phosphate-mannose--protein O-mannosyl transferase
MKKNIGEIILDIVLAGYDWATNMSGKWQGITIMSLVVAVCLLAWFK